MILHITVLGRDEFFLQLVDRFLNQLNGLGALLEEFDHTDEGSTHVVVRLAQQGLFDEPIETLHVLLVDNLGEDTQGVCLDNIVVRLLDIFVEAGNDNEDLVLVDLKLLDEDIDQATESLVLVRRHREQLRHVEEHGGLFKISEVLALYNERARLVHLNRNLHVLLTWFKR